MYFKNICFIKNYIPHYYRFSDLPNDYLNIPTNKDNIITDRITTCLSNELTNPNVRANANTTDINNVNQSSDMETVKSVRVKSEPYAKRSRYGRLNTIRTSVDTSLRIRPNVFGSGLIRQYNVTNNRYANQQRTYSDTHTDSLTHGYMNNYITTAPTSIPSNINIKGPRSVIHLPEASRVQPPTNTDRFLKYVNVISNWKSKICIFITYSNDVLII